MDKRKISIITPCYNEEGNLPTLIRRCQDVMRDLQITNYEHIFIDNDSTDKTQLILKNIATEDKRIKIIINNRNFGHIRSPFYGLLQCSGDAAILLAADLQDPPELISVFVERWKAGAKVVLGVKTNSDESSLMFATRKLYYNFVSKVSDTELVKNNTGFGLYDREVINALSSINDPYPYFRGLISELGFPSIKIPYHQPQRYRGITSNNFYKLYDIAMLGITSHSKVPLRVATIAGFILSVVSLFLGLAFFFLKLIFWDKFQLGIAPILIGFFSFMSVQLFFTGIIGEYVGFIHTQVLKRPLVTEKERINFD